LNVRAFQEGGRDRKSGKSKTKKGIERRKSVALGNRGEKGEDEDRVTQWGRGRGKETFVFVRKSRLPVEKGEWGAGGH